MTSPETLARQIIYRITHGHDGQVIPDKTKPVLKKTIIKALVDYAHQVRRETNERNHLLLRQINRHIKAGWNGKHDRLLDAAELIMKELHRTPIRRRAQDSD